MTFVYYLPDHGKTVGKWWAKAINKAVMKDMSLGKIIALKLWQDERFNESLYRQPWQP